MPLIQKPGRYTATTKTVALGESEKGNPFVSILFETDAGEELTAYLYLTDAAIDRTVRRLREVFAFDNNFETVAKQVEGRTASIVCEEEEYDGKKKLVVKWVNKVTTAKPIAGGSSLLAQLTAKAKRVADEAPKASTATPRTTAPAWRVESLAVKQTEQNAGENVPF